MRTEKDNVAIDILGEEWDIIFATRKEYKYKHKNSGGETVFYKKIIYIVPLEDKAQEDEVIIHEVQHALLFVAGQEDYYLVESLISTYAMLLPKIFKICKELDCLG